MDTDYGHNILYIFTYLFTCVFVNIYVRKRERERERERGERERERERERTYDISLYSLNIFITLSLKSFVESFISNLLKCHDMYM